jgi:GNAT superfamily N-acetyltransferase
MLNHLPPQERPLAFRKLFGGMVHLASTSDALFMQASTFLPNESAPTAPQFHCVAIMVRPGASANQSFALPNWPNLVRSGILGLLWQVGLFRFTRTTSEYPALVAPVKASLFAEGETYYYVQMIATDVAHRGKGLCSRLLVELQRRAQEEGKPVWLEGSTWKNRCIYERIGFEDVGGPLVIGKGECGEDGEKASGELAVGVSFYPMVWWPEGYVRGR